MLPRVETSGWMPLLIAAFSAGRPKASQPNGMQHVVAAHPLHARHHVADDVVADVADVRVPGRVREHLEAVELRARRVGGHLERARRGPALLPLPVEFLRTIVGHTGATGSGLRASGYGEMRAVAGRILWTRPRAGTTRSVHGRSPEPEARSPIISSSIAQIGTDRGERRLGARRGTSRRGKIRYRGLARQRAHGRARGTQPAPSGRSRLR